MTTSRDHHSGQSTLSFGEKGESEDVRVLAVDDNPDNLLTLSAVLDGSGLTIDRATSGDEALRRLLERDYAVILLDVQMPGMDGFELAALVRQRERSAHTPIIFMTAFDESDIPRAYALGAVDFIAKPFVPAVLKAKVSVFVELFRKSAEAEREAELRRRAEERLRRQAESDLRRMVESVKDYAIFTIDPSGRIASWNSGARNLFGYDEAEILGQDAGLLFTPEDRARGVPERELELAKETGRGEDERWHQRKDGSRFFASGIVTPISEAGEIVGFTKVARDVTERKRAESRAAAHHTVSRILAESRTTAEAMPRVLRTICENLGWDVAGLWMVDEGANALRHVDSWHIPSLIIDEFEDACRGRSFPPGIGLPGRVWASRNSLWLEDTRDDANFPRAALAAKIGLKGAFAIPILLEDEVLGVMEFFCREVRPPDEQTLEMMAAIGRQVGQFIERKRAEEALRQSEARKAAVLETALDCIITIDEDSRVVEWNPAAERTFGYSRAEALSQSMADLIVPPGLRERHYRGMSHYLRTGEGPLLGKRVEVTAQRKDRSVFPAELAIAPIRVGQRQLFTAHLRDIAPRLQANRALRESEEWLRLVTSSLPMLIGYVDRGLRYRFANETYREWFGVPPQAIVGKHIGEILGEATSRQRMPYIEAALRGETIRFEGLTMHKDLGPRETEMTYVPHVTSDGVQGFFVVVHDITERKHAEDRLKLQARVLESMAEGVSVADEDGFIVYTNPAEDAMFGYEPGELIGRHVTVQNTYPPEENARRVAGVIEHLKTRGVWSGEFSNRRKDGTAFTTHCHITTLEMAGRRHFVCVQFDVTERKLWQERLEQSEERYRTFIKQSSEGIWRFEAGEPIPIDQPEDELIERFYRTVSLAECNDAMARMYGYAAASDIIGARLDAFLPRSNPHNVEYLRAFIRSGFRLDEAESHEVDRGGNPKYFLNNLVGIIEDGKLLRAWGTQRDITDRKRAEEALKENDRRKDEFLAMLAHELRNPLASVSNAVKVLQLRGPKDPELVWGRNVIEQQVRHLARLLDDLLDVSRITQGLIHLHKERLDASSLASRAVEAVRPSIESKNQKLSVSFEPGPLWCEADPVRLEQVLVNLLSNATKYTEEGGRIRLEVRREGDHIVIRVRDSGIGIPPEKLPQMFELFAQGDRSLARSEGGLGIGLTVVKRLVELHGGTVTARSEGIGRGSEFTVRLSAVAERPPAPRKPESAAPSHGHRSRILVVDDNVDTARGLSKLLRLLGHDVKTAYDGPSAIEVAREQRPEFVLLDIGLPGMDGYQVAERLRREECCRDAVLIAVTGYGQEQDRARSRATGFDHHLVKPVDYGALVSLIGQPS